VITVRAQTRRRRNAGLSVTETLIIVCICAALVLLSMMWHDWRSRQARRVRCTSSLSGLGAAMKIYLEKYGDESEGAGLPGFADPDADALPTANIVPSKAHNVRPTDTGER